MEVTSRTSTLLKIRYISFQIFDEKNEPTDVFYKVFAIDLLAYHCGSNILIKSKVFVPKKKPKTSIMGSDTFFLYYKLRKLNDDDIITFLATIEVREEDQSDPEAGNSWGHSYRPGHPDSRRGYRVC